MRALLKSFISLIVAFSLSMAHANQFQAKLSTGGFLGEYGLGLNYELKQRWRFMLGYGNTLGLGVQIHQANTAADYAWFKPIKLRDGLRWTPITTGLGGVYTFNREFFVESPEEYPEKTYYQQTAFHALVLFGTQLRARIYGWRVYGEYFVGITDTYIMAQFNNSKWTSYYCCSSGFSLIVPF